MDSFIAGLCTSLSSPALWGAFASIIPILAISVLFGLGMQLIEGVIYMINHPAPDDEYLRKTLDEKNNFNN